MYLDPHGPVVSATDLTRFLACPHVTELDLAALRGQLVAPAGEDELLNVLFARGLEHEHKVVAGLRRDGVDVVDIDPDDDPLLRTREAMLRGAGVVYQAAFRQGPWRGYADFLVKVAGRPSQCGNWSYDVADTKLARRLKVAALLQMSVYAEGVAEIQGVPPQRLFVVTGDGTWQPYRFADCAAYARHVRAGLLDALTAPAATEPEPNAHCAQCRWAAHCAAGWRAHDDLSVVAFMRRDQRRVLRDAGVLTLAGLAAADPTALPAAIGAPSRERLVAQARLQLAERVSGKPGYELLAYEPGRGLARLPEPSPGDLFFDIEGDPYAADEGVEYLFGVVDRAGAFEAFWGHAEEPGGERGAFERFIDRVMTAWDADPGMHVYHYAPYEPTKLKALMSRYATREQEVDRLLRGQRLVDLYAVVRQGLRISKPSYSIKKLEDFYWGQVRGSSPGADVSDALSSVIAYERWLTSRDPAELAAIAHYNELDCLSTRDAREWLEQRRAELARTTDVPVSRPQLTDGTPTDAQIEAQSRVARLAADLKARLPDDPADRTDTQAATWLLADLLDWHRREARPEWWDYYRRLDLTDDELVDDPAAVGLIGAGEYVADVKRSAIWQYAFPPQDTKLPSGPLRYVDPATQQPPASLVESVDPETGLLRLRRGNNQPAPAMRALIPGPPLPQRNQQEALYQLGEQVREHGVDGPGPRRAARDLLLRRPPRLADPRPGPLLQPGEEPATAVVRLGAGLDRGVLAVQGPPGTGKTYAGARLVVSLLAAGQRVGICAYSHKVIGNLLDEVGRVAAEQGLPLRGLQKCQDSERCESRCLPHTIEPKKVADALGTGEITLAAGTAWLFARPDMQNILDTLVIDEAGQMSLANVLAVAAAADNLVLLGDPQQLAQPQKGVHPPGAQASALDHLLGGHDTIAADRGILLDRTYRMHPHLAGFISTTFYDRRLGSAAGCRGQHLNAPGRLTGTGAHWIPVEHHDNASASSEEADTVAALVDDLLRGAWTDRSGRTRPLTLPDILIITPYNAQVARIRSRAPRGARVGTVDKFQGQEAAVVIYSMATSTAADAPHDIGFLYAGDRLNVAISRARCLAAIVASPALLDAPVRTPDQLKKVNALVAFTEIARTSVPVPRNSGPQTALAVPN